MRFIGVVRESEVVWRPHSCRPSPLSFIRLVLPASSTSLFISTSPPVHSIRAAVAFTTISVGPAAGSAEVFWIRYLCEPSGITSSTGPARPSSYESWPRVAEGRRGPLGLSPPHLLLVHGAGVFWCPPSACLLKQAAFTHTLMFRQKRQADPGYPPSLA